MSDWWLKCLYYVLKVPIVLQAQHGVGFRLGFEAGLFSDGFCGFCGQTLDSWWFPYDYLIAVAVLLVCGYQQICRLCDMQDSIFQEYFLIFAVEKYENSCTDNDCNGGTNGDRNRGDVRGVL